MGDLPAPPLAFSWILVILGVVAFLLGLQMLMTGRVLIRFGTLKGVSTARAVRFLGLALLLDSMVSLWLAYDFTYLSRHQVPPTWAELILLPTIVVTGLQWLAFRMDRRRKGLTLR